jgi:hypothetical protein
MLGLFAAARERYSGYLADLLNAVQPFPFSTWEAEERHKTVVPTDATSR